MAEELDHSRIRIDAREIAASYSRVDNWLMGGCLVGVLGSVIGAAFLAARTADSWWGKILHGVGWWFAGAVGCTCIYGFLDSWAKSRACKRFYARFPKGSPEREEAMRVLSGYDSDDHVSEAALFEALGGRASDYATEAGAPTADAAVQQALAELDPPDHWPPEPAAEEEPPRTPPTWRGGVIPLRPDPPKEEE